MGTADGGRLICFDLDGVIYSAEPFLGDAYREAIALVEQKRPGSFERVPSTSEILDHVGWPVPVILARLFPRVDDAAVRLLYAETLEVICARVAATGGRPLPRRRADAARLCGATAFWPSPPTAGASTSRRSSPPTASPTASPSASPPIR